MIQFLAGCGLFFADWFLCWSVTHSVKTAWQRKREVRFYVSFPKGGKVMPFTTAQAKNAWHAPLSTGPKFVTGGIVNGPGNHSHDLCRLPCGFDPDDSTPHLHEGLTMRVTDIKASFPEPQGPGQQVAREKGRDLGTLLLNGNRLELQQFFAGINEIEGGGINTVDPSWELVSEQYESPVYSSQTPCTTQGAPKTEILIRVHHGSEIPRTALEQKLEADRKAALQLTQNPEPDEHDEDEDWGCGCC